MKQKEVLVAEEVADFLVTFALNSILGEEPTIVAPLQLHLQYSGLVRVVVPVDLQLFWGDAEEFLLVALDAWYAAFLDLVEDGTACLVLLQAKLLARARMRCDFSDLRQILAPILI